MKIRRSVLWFIVLVIAAAALVAWFSRRQAPTTVPKTPGAGQDEARSPSQPNRVGRKVAPRDSPPAPKLASSNQLNATNANEVMSQYRQGLIDWGQARRAILSLENDVPIVFYGKVEDEFGSPLVDTTVRFSVSFANGYAAGVKEGEMVTDSTGSFTISGYTGESLSVRPEKPGYVIASANGGAIYSHLWPEEQRHHPDPSRPMIIKMRKLKGAERLVHFQGEVRVPRDGSPVFFDLVAGKVVEAGGDLVISIESPDQLSGPQRYDWTASLRVVGGGLTPPEGVDFDQMYLAPQSGYDERFAMTQQKDARRWSSRFHGTFYVRSRNSGCYSKLAIGIVSDAVKGGTVPVKLDYYANPASSPKLEIDSNLVTELR